MPASTFRDYYLWGLDANNPYHDTWISVTGLKKTVQFTLDSAASSFDDAHIPTFACYAAPMTIYLTFEVISDNLEFGLCDLNPRDRTHFLRAHLIREFSKAMCLRLKGTQTSAAMLLEREAILARRISTHRQSISPEKLRIVAEAFRQQHPGISPRDLDAGLLPQLIMNIESAVDVVHFTRKHHTAQIIHKGLLGRYRSAERVFRDPNLNLSRILTHGANTILLIPVVAYYLEMGANAFGISDRLRTAVDDGTLERALYQCSLLVRLLNDLGTPIIMQTPEQRHDLLMGLRFQAQNSPSGNIRSFLREQVNDQPYRRQLTRIAKDVEKGEFNIALYNLPHINPLDQALLTFGERLSALSRVYHRTQNDLTRQLDVLNHTLGTDAISAMIQRVVDFHYEMYYNDYRQANGDYAR